MTMLVMVSFTQNAVLGTRRMRDILCFILSLQPSFTGLASSLNS